MDSHFRLIVLCSVIALLPAVYYLFSHKNTVAAVAKVETFQSTTIPVAVSEDTLDSSVEKPAPEIQPSTGIYRWIDSEGHVQFSDRATNPAATQHSLQPIGYIEVSPDIKRRVAIDQARLLAENPVPVKSQNASGSVRPQKISTKYQFSTLSAGQKHGYVYISGRIVGGQRCQQLRINASARSDSGGYASGGEDVSFAGFGSSLFEIKKSSSWNGRSRRPQWELVKVTATCLSI